MPGAPDIDRRYGELLNLDWHECIDEVLVGGQDDERTPMAEAFSQEFKKSFPTRQEFGNFPQCDNWTETLWTSCVKGWVRAGGEEARDPDTLEPLHLNMLARLGMLAKVTLKEATAEEIAAKEEVFEKSTLLIEKYNQRYFRLFSGMFTPESKAMKKIYEGSMLDPSSGIQQPWTPALSKIKAQDPQVVFVRGEKPGGKVFSGADSGYLLAVHLETLLNGMLLVYGTRAVDAEGHIVEDAAAGGQRMMFHPDVASRYLHFITNRAAGLGHPSLVASNKRLTIDRILELELETRQDWCEWYRRKSVDASKEAKEGLCLSDAIEDCWEAMQHRFNEASRDLISSVVVKPAQKPVTPRRSDFKGQSKGGQTKGGPGKGGQVKGGQAKGGQGGKGQKFRNQTWTPAKREWSQAEWDEWTAAKDAKKAKTAAETAKTDA